MAWLRSAVTWVRYWVAVTDGSVGGNRRRVYYQEALAFAEKGKQNKRYESEALQNDGNGDGTLFDAAGPPFGLRIAFDQATAE